MRFLLPAVLIVLLSWLGCFEPSSSPEARLVQDHFRYDAPSKTVTAWQLGGATAHDPAVLAVGDARWFAWLEYEPGAGDQLRFEKHSADEVVASVTIDTGSQCARPTLHAASGGRIWATWEQREGDEDWDVIIAEIGDEPRWRRLRTPGTHEIHHAAAVSPSGELWIAAQRCLGGEYRIDVTRIELAKALDDDTEPSWETVSEPMGSWEPDIAVGPDGSVTVVWDAYRGDAFGVRARQRTGSSWGPIRVIADSPRYEGRAQVATDSKGRTWIVWEEGAERWGQHYTGVARRWNGSTVESGPLHRVRRVHVARLEADGRLSRPAEPVPMPSFAEAAALEDRREGASELGVYYERPALVVDGLDRPWVVYRHYFETQLACHEAVVHHIEQGFAVQARCLTEDGWSPLQGLDVKQRDGAQRMGVSATSKGLCIALETGRSDRRPDDRPRGAWAAELSEPGERPSDSPLGEARTVVARPDALTPSRRPVVATQVGGTTYELVLGDLHRHTDLSLCFPFYDGSLDDVYRYAFQVAGLDFLGVTDHTRDIDLGNGESLLWWRCLKKVSQHHVPGRFHPFFAYERSHRDTDHNVISLRDDMLRNFPPPLPDFWAEIDDDRTFTIPHATPNREDEPYNGKIWDYQDDAKRPLVEVYQGFREAESIVPAQVPLLKGYHLGFIASSDHLTTRSSYAATWTPERDREAIFRSLQARRTYGATDEIRLVLRSGGHWMGERMKADGAIELRIEAHGTAPFEEAGLWIDGSPEVELPVDPESPLFLQIDWRWEVPDDGEEHYVFVRLEQTDGRRAWSSPLWVTRNR